MKKFIIYRLLSVALVRTHFVADEYWQSLEVAHKIVFSYGHLTWEWTNGLRSPVYPILISLVYKTLQIVGLDFYTCIIYAPRICQAFFTAICDHYFYLLCKRFNLSTRWTLLTILTNWFYFYCGSRTLINTFETNLVVLAMYVFPWGTLTVKKPSSCISFAIIICVNCLIRPTSCVLWLPFCCYWIAVSNKTQIQTILATFSIVGTVTFVASLILDSYFYGKFTITAWNFITFNVFHGISTFYGAHPFHWYLLQGLPAILGLQLIPFIIEYGHIIRGNVSPRQYHVNGIIIFTVTCSILLLSFLPHKEFRFILPITPMAMFIGVQYLDRITDRRRSRQWAAAMVLSFVVPSVLFGWIHQRGALPTMRHLADELVQNDSGNLSFFFLMPCHSMPLYSHLHVNVSTRFLSCEPPLTPDSKDESDDFFYEPSSWLYEQWSNSPKRPSHVIIYDNLVPLLQNTLQTYNYTEQIKFPHTIFPEKRIGENVVIFKNILIK